MRGEFTAAIVQPARAARFAADCCGPRSGLAGPAAASPARTVGESPAQPTALPYPILFASRVPIAVDLVTAGPAFSSQEATLGGAGRGDDLWIQYTDGTMKSHTAVAGGGSTGMVTGTNITVRDSSVYSVVSKAVYRRGLARLPVNMSITGPSAGSWMKALA